MKSVLISIKPKWVEKIANKEKTIEVRKTRPKIKTPFKCYIYCTIGNGIKGDYLIPSNLQCGKVIGEFVCDKIEEFHEYELSPCKKFYEFEKARLDLFLIESCLSYNEVCDYRKNLPYYKSLYGWHISDLKIYDKPKPIMQFYKPCPIEWKNCPGCEFYSTNTGCCMNNVDRPPQSWCYVEEV